MYRVECHLSRESRHPYDSYVILLAVSGSRQESKGEDDTIVPPGKAKPLCLLQKMGSSPTPLSKLLSAISPLSLSLYTHPFPRFSRFLSSSRIVRF